MELKEIYRDRVYSIQYAGDTVDVFHKLINDWQDPEYIHEYIYSHIQFIEDNEHFEGFTMVQIELSIRREGREFERRFRWIKGNDETGRYPTLEDVFKTFDKDVAEYDAEALQRRKMYGKKKDDDNLPSVLRLYALRIEPTDENSLPAYVITGGAIKLSDNIQQMKELQAAKRALYSAQDWLKQKGITSTSTLTLGLNS